MNRSKIIGIQGTHPHMVNQLIVEVIVIAALIGSLM